MTTLTDLAAEHRVPIESGRWWIVSLDPFSADPTDEEMVLIRAYTEVVTTSYREPFASKALADPVGCVVGGHNTCTLLKRSDGDWAYRRSTWTIGPRFMPAPNGGYDRGFPASLPALLERIETFCWGSSSPSPSTRWTDWTAGAGAPLLEAVS